jgi:hypothetical protein
MTSSNRITELIMQRECACKNGDRALAMNLQDDINSKVNERDREDFLAQVKQSD